MGIIKIPITREYYDILNEKVGIDGENKLKTLKDALSKKDGYKELNFNILTLTNINYQETGIISESGYNKAAQILKLNRLDLERNQIFTVPGNKITKFNLYDSDTFKLLDKKSTYDLEIIGESERSITPEGYLEIF